MAFVLFHFFQFEIKNLAEGKKIFIPELLAKFFGCYYILHSTGQFLIINNLSLENNKKSWTWLLVASIENLFLYSAVYSSPTAMHFQLCIKSYWSHLKHPYQRLIKTLRVKWLFQIQISVKQQWAQEIHCQDTDEIYSDEVLLLHDQSVLHLPSSY